ncbi:hypothetical protein, partial [Szabonella alba]
LVASHGFAELLADTPEDYIALARSLGTDPARRNAIRTRLKQAGANPGFVGNPDHARALREAIEDMMREEAAGGQ